MMTGFFFLSHEKKKHFNYADFKLLYVNAIIATKL